MSTPACHVSSLWPHNHTVFLVSYLHLPPLATDLLMLLGEVRAYWGNIRVHTCAQGSVCVVMCIHRPPAVCVCECRGLPCACALLQAPAWMAAGSSMTLRVCSEPSVHTSGCR